LLLHFQPESFFHSPFISAANHDHQFFDAFSSNIQDPAAAQQVVVTFLLFSSAWELIVATTTGPVLGPILRGIIQVLLLAELQGQQHYYTLLSRFVQLLRDAYVLSFVG
jgi:hypothetical protein